MFQVSSLNHKPRRGWAAALAAFRLWQGLSAPRLDKDRAAQLQLRLGSEHKRRREQATFHWSSHNAFLSGHSRSKMDAQHAVSQASLERRYGCDCAGLPAAT